ncbi:benzoate transporter [Nesterenkonia cremea]|uniref:Benzoate transporter n=1 Tax=Nesterenkonia cremea TaxID=1882340 RepID=A0A917AW38_9MICC|nr:benzoate transporter [Nesterenkonia cremea]
MSQALTTATPAKERRTAAWVAFIACTALVFDGYDLTIYGTVMPTLMNDPSHIGPLDGATAGALGSYAMLGVLAGALITGGIGDYLGRRRMILLSITWFSVGMILTSFATSVLAFGLLRFLTGLGLGAVLATAGATMAEFAPADKKNLYNAIVYAGIPAGGVLAALLGMILLDPIGWRGLFLIGALPILLIPVAWFKLPESPRWLLSRGRREEAIRVAERTGIALVDESQTADDKAVERTGFAALMTPRYLLPTILIGFMSFSGLLLTYGLNTWLPRIMEGYGYGTTYSLAFLLFLNGGAVIGCLLGSKVADRVGPKRVVTGTFILAALSLSLMTIELPFATLLLLISIAGVGTLGTQVLIYGFVATYYTTNTRAAGVAWCAGFGRLGGVAGPAVGGLITTLGLTGGAAFYVFGGVALFGAGITQLVRRQKDLEEIDVVQREQRQTQDA